MTTTRKSSQPYSRALGSNNVSSEYRRFKTQEYAKDGRKRKRLTDRAREPCWHHWDDKYPELGLWLCAKCHWLAESVECDPHQKLMDLYKKLRESVSL